MRKSRLLKALALMLCGALVLAGCQNIASKASIASTNETALPSPFSAANAAVNTAANAAVTADLQTPSGPVRGVVENGVAIYKGIPYAKPPVGDLRFAPTQDVVPWTNVLECDKFGAIAVQAVSADSPAAPPKELGMSEDCLTLNIWTPSTANEEPLPVYVWIHGGGFAEGNGTSPQFDGTNFAKEGIVVVTINYRLNALGFFASQQTYDEYGTTGNWGLLDQIKALEWIQKNIGAFGGDSQRVTVGGESAGAYCVSALITSPLAKGLFQRAIMESGSILGVPGNSYYARGDLSRSIEVSRMMARTFGAADDARGLSALRSADANVFAQLSPLNADFTKTPAFMMLPVFDGYVQPTDVYAALQSGGFNKVDLLWGYNADEGSVFVPENTVQPTYAMLAARMYGYENSKAVLARFPIDAQHTAGQRAREILAYGMFSAVMKPYADALSSGGQKVYAYRFDYATAQNTELGLGAHHGSEIEYTFGNLPDGAGAQAQALSREMFLRWANFIKNGDPNQGAQVGENWPVYSADGSQMLILDEKISAAEMPGKEDILFMEGIMFGSGAAY